METYREVQSEDPGVARREARLLLAITVLMPAAMAAVFSLLIIFEQGLDTALAAAAAMIVIAAGGARLVAPLLASSER